MLTIARCEEIVTRSVRGIEAAEQQPDDDRVDREVEEKIGAASRRGERSRGCRRRRQYAEYRFPPVCSIDAMY